MTLDTDTGGQKTNRTLVESLITAVKRAYQAAEVFLQYILVAMGTVFLLLARYPGEPGPTREVVLSEIGAVLISVGLLHFTYDHLIRHHHLIDVRTIVDEVVRDHLIHVRTIIHEAVRDHLTELPKAELSERSDDAEYHAAIQKAQRRVWIHQTWFPGHAKDADEIVQSPAPKKRVLLMSFKDGSPIFARIAGRTDIKGVDGAKTDSYGSAEPLVRADVPLRFSFGHHPGWIATIDSCVFWGPTPVHKDNHSLQYLFHRHRASFVDEGAVLRTSGEFWPSQFELLWSYHSHDLGTEMEYNELLRKLKGGNIWEQQKEKLRQRKSDLPNEISAAQVALVAARKASAPIDIIRELEEKVDALRKELAHIDQCLR